MESLPHPNVLHISESCGWPHSLKTLTAYLGHANGITVSSIASDKMDDADSRQQTIEEPNSLNELDSVYDLIMLSASKARDPNTTMEILQTYQSLLFATLGCVISGDRVSNAFNVSFLLPRIGTGVDLFKNEREWTRSDADGHAILVVSLAVNDPTRTVSHDDAERAISHYEDTSIPETLVVDGDDVEYVTAETDHSSIQENIPIRKHESDPYADACTDSYILVRDNWTLLTHIPLFLIADGNNIMNLMTSALYQRYVWSINEPLIGIELMGRYARVYLGWLDYDSGYEQSVTLRIACAESDISASPSLGVYDLTDISQTCVLARFLLRLRRQQDVISALPFTSSKLRKFCWRHDHACLGATNMDNNAYINMWRANSLPADYVEEVSHETVEGGTVANNHTNTMARPQNLLTRTIVCDGYNSKRPSAFSWLFERLVEEIPTRPAIATMSDYDTIKRVLSIYSGFIEHVKIRRWANQDPGSPNLSYSKALRAQLQALLEMHNTHPTSLDRGRQDFYLDDDAELFLEKRLHIILGVPLLNTVVSSISRNTAAQQLWNTILATFLAGDRCNNMITSGVRFNVDVRLSRNHVVDGLVQTKNDATLREALVKKLRTFALTSINRAEEYHYRDKNLETAEIRVSVAFHRRDENTLQLAFLLSKPDDELLSQVWSRASVEPTSGLCDAVGFQRLPISYLGRTMPLPPNLSFMLDPPMSNDSPQTLTGVSGVESQSIAPPDHIDLPTILCVFQHPDDQSAMTSFRRLCIYMTSAVDMYSHLGIHDVSVWGLHIDGLRADLLLARKCPETMQTFIVQRETRTFDITNSFEVMQLAALLIRIQGGSSLPPRRNEDVGVSTEPWPLWTQESQESVPAELQSKVPEVIGDPDWDADIPHPEPRCYTYWRYGGRALE